MKMSSINAAEVPQIAHSSEFDCGCPACVGFVEPMIDTLAYDVGLGASVDNLAGTRAANGKNIWSPDQIAAHLNRTGGGFDNPNSDGPRRGSQNNIGDDDSVITFGFFNTQDDVANNGYSYTANNAQGVPTLYAYSEYFNFAPFNDAQRAAARDAMGFWDDVISVSFREADVNDADMNFGNLASAPQTQAYARIPTAGLDAALGGQVREIGGDSWYSASQASNFQLAPGGYGLNTLTHEIGHAIGLSHPGSYNFGPGFSVNYANGAEYFQDARNYSIMSYWNPRDIGARDFNWNVMALAYGGVPMVHDILAAQRIYGVDTTTRTGDTVYGFNSTAGKDVFDFNINEAPTIAIWDAGGNDTLDASGYRTNQEINLNPGSLSSIGGVTYAEALERLSFEQVNANRAELGYGPTSLANYNANLAALANNNLLGRLTDNVGIAYGAIIENAVGGSGDDRLIANGVANVLDGGTGFDTASYRDATAGVTVNLTTGGGVRGDAAGDRYRNIEAFEGSAFGDTMTGGNANDTLFGLDGADALAGGNADDTLDGGLGDDTLRGDSGRDVLRGGAGADALYGGNDVDALEGGADNDLLDGGNGDDTLLGGAGDDTLTGGNGNDVLRGDGGNDTLTGGSGNDIFQMFDLGGTDVITDFRRGDRIDMSGLDAITGGGDDGFSWVGAAGFSGEAGQLRSYSEGSRFFLAGDVDGDSVADFLIQTNVAINQADVIFG